MVFISSGQAQRQIRALGSVANMTFLLSVFGFLSILYKEVTIMNLG